MWEGILIIGVGSIVLTIVDAWIREKVRKK